MIPVHDAAADQELLLSLPRFSRCWWHSRTEAHGLVSVSALWAVEMHLSAESVSRISLKILPFLL